ncbi:MAG: hypothetical protein PH343_06435 [Nitrospira sp.]|nr:hypothetical protein [Nitrospira sp.]
MKRITGRLEAPLYISIVFWIMAVFFMTISKCYAFELNGFTDVSFTQSNGNVSEHGHGDFALGTVDLYLAQNLEDTEILVEIGIEEGDVLDLERVSIGYTFSDALRLRAGRFHTPLGFWNTSYHHGVQLQPTIKRPEFLRFEDDGGIIPAHMIGAYASGRVRSSLGAIEYGVLIGNGPRITNYENMGHNSLVPNNIEDNNSEKAFAVHASISPEAIEGLKAGISGHFSKIQTDKDALGSAVNVDQSILAAALKYGIGNTDLSGEYFIIQNKDNLGGGTKTSNAYYGLATYSINDKFIPYLMYDNISADQSDPYFKSLGTQDISNLTAGLRYNISYRSSLKGEVRAVDKGNDTWNEYGIQWALAF